MNLSVINQVNQVSQVHQWDVKTDDLLQSSKWIFYHCMCVKRNRDRVCICMCVACRDQININVFRSSSIPSLSYFFSPCFLLSQELTDSARLCSPQASGILLSASLVPGLQACAATLNFLNRIWDPNSGTFACMVLMLTTLSHLFRLLRYYLLKILDFIVMH